MKYNNSIKNAKIKKRILASFLTMAILGLSGCGGGSGGGSSPSPSPAKENIKATVTMNDMNIDLDSKRTYPLDVTLEKIDQHKLALGAQVLNSVCDVTLSEIPKEGLLPIIEKPMTKEAELSAQETKITFDLTPEQAAEAQGNAAGKHQFDVGVVCNNEVLPKENIDMSEINKNGGISVKVPVIYYLAKDKDGKEKITDYEFDSGDTLYLAAEIAKDINESQTVKFTDSVEGKSSIIGEVSVDASDSDSKAATGVTVTNLLKENVDHLISPNLEGSDNIKPIIDETLKKPITVHFKPYVQWNDAKWENDQTPQVQSGGSASGNFIDNATVISWDHQDKANYQTTCQVTDIKGENLNDQPSCDVDVEKHSVEIHGIEDIKKDYLVHLTAINPKDDADTVTDTLSIQGAIGEKIDWPSHGEGKETSFIATYNSDTEFKLDQGQFEKDAFVANKEGEKDRDVDFSSCRVIANDEEHTQDEDATCTINEDQSITLANLTNQEKDYGVIVTAHDPKEIVADSDSAILKIDYDINRPSINWDAKGHDFKISEVHPSKAMGWVTTDAQLINPFEDDKVTYQCVVEDKKGGKAVAGDNCTVREDGMIVMDAGDIEAHKKGVLLPSYFAKVTASSEKYPSISKSFEYQLNDLSAKIEVDQKDFAGGINPGEILELDSKDQTKVVPSFYYFKTSSVKGINLPEDDEIQYSCSVGQDQHSKCNIDLQHDNELVITNLTPGYQGEAREVQVVISDKYNLAKPVMIYDGEDHGGVKMVKPMLEQNVVLNLPKFSDDFFNNVGNPLWLDESKPIGSRTKIKSGYKFSIENLSLGNAPSNDKVLLTCKVVDDEKANCVIDENGNLTIDNLIPGYAGDSRDFVVYATDTMGFVIPVLMDYNRDSGEAGYYQKTIYVRNDV